MGIFKRKDSRVSIDSGGKDARKTSISVSSTRTSNGSLRSPGFRGSGGAKSRGGSATVPEIPILRPVDPALDPAAYLRGIHAVRERSCLVLDRAKKDGLQHFDVNMSKFKDTASYVASIIKVDIYILFSFLYYFPLHH